MPYSKRWELFHILGGGCVECGNQNFYELELDHIHNDGDGERAYYTNLEARYANNPKRAKQRLQILCKKCHKDKHRAPTISPKLEREVKMKLFMETMKTLEGYYHSAVPEFVIISKFGTDADVSNDQARQYIRRMLREASIYESKPGHYNLVSKEFVFDP